MFRVELGRPYRIIKRENLRAFTCSDNGLGRPQRIIQRENLWAVTCLEWNLVGLFRIIQKENLSFTCSEWNLVGLQKQFREHVSMQMLSFEILAH